MITRAQLAALYPRATPGRLDAIAASVPAVLPRFGLDRIVNGSNNRLTFFLAQLGHESGGMTIVEENLNYSAERLVVVFPSRFPTLAAAAPFARNPEKLANQVYGSRMGNGAPASGDGFRYRGRGLIQLTGKSNYRAIGAIAGLPLEAQPALAGESANLLAIAAAFWQSRSINDTADANDFKRCTKLINGGTIGLPDRLEWLDKARRVLATVPAKKAQPPAETVIAVQKKLLALGFKAIGAADGDIGPKTVTAISAFRMQKGLPASEPQAPIDDSLLRALGL